MTHSRGIKQTKKLDFLSIDNIGYGVLIYCGFDFADSLGYLMILFSFFAILHNYHKANHA